MVTAMGLVKAKNKKLEIMNREMIDLDDSLIGLPGSPTQPGEIFTPDLSRKSQRLDGTEEEIALRILEIIRKSGVKLGIGGIRN
jgi:electron transfer flavoprotein beta subunit